jgi:hypothetical protein
MDWVMDRVVTTAVPSFSHSLVTPTCTTNEHADTLPFLALQRIFAI